MNSPKINSNSLIPFGVVLSVGLVVAMWLLAGALKNIKGGDERLSVKGYAEKKIVSDLGVWSGSVTVSAYDMASAYARLENDMNAVLDFLGARGVKKDGVEQSAVNSMILYKTDDRGYSTSERSGVQLTQTFSVTSKDVNLIARLSKEVTSLIANGIEVVSYMPGYYYTKLDELKIDLLAAATRDAKNRAEAMAGSTDSKVGGIASANQGIFQITAPNSTETADYGMYDLSTIEKSIKAVVTVNFSIR